MAVAVTVVMHLRESLCGVSEVFGYVLECLGTYFWRGRGGWLLVCDRSNGGASLLYRRPSPGCWFDALDGKDANGSVFRT